MVVNKNAAELARRVAQLRAEEEALDAIFEDAVLEVTITTKTASLKVAVTRQTGAAVVHELLLAAIDKREKAEKQQAKPGR